MGSNWFVYEFKTDGKYKITMVGDKMEIGTGEV